MYGRGAPTRTRHQISPGSDLIQLLSNEVSPLFQLVSAVVQEDHQHLTLTMSFALAGRGRKQVCSASARKLTAVPKQLNKGAFVLRVMQQVKAWNHQCCLQMATVSVRTGSGSLPVYAACFFVMLTQQHQQV